MRQFALLLFCGALSAAALGCPYSIRDAGFIVRDPVPYRLVTLTCDAAPAAVAALKATQSKAAAQELDLANVEPVALEKEHPGEDPALQRLTKAYGAECTGGGRQVLLRPDGESLLLELPQGKEPLERYASLLRSVVDSPKRQEIVRQIVAAWCVVLVVESTDAAQNLKVTKAAQAAAEGLVGFRPEMGDPVDAAPPVLTVKSDDPQEQVLRFALGLDEGDRQQTRVAIVFGKGRRVGPVLTAAQATEGRLRELFRLLGKNCTCTADPTWLLGPALPLNWGRNLQSQVREELGFDPNNPAVAATLSGVWKTLRSTDGSLVPGETVPEPTTGYVEFSVEPGEKPAEKPDPDATNDPEARDPDEGASLEQRSIRAAEWAAAGLTVAALGGSAMLIIRARRRA